MSEHNITGKKVAFLLNDGVEQVELTSPWDAVKEAGRQPVLIFPRNGKLQGYEGNTSWWPRSARRPPVTGLPAPALMGQDVPCNHVPPLPAGNRTAP